MRRREFMALVAGAVTAAPLAAHAQQARIGFLAYNEMTPQLSGYVVEFRKELAALGHVEGRNLRTTILTAQRKPDALPGLAGDLVSQKVDVIVANSAPELRAAMAATTEIPIVVVLAVNLPETGFVATLARPGGNVTGLDSQVADLGAKRLELLKQILPSATRFAFLADGVANRIQQGTVQKTVQAARTLGVSLAVVEARTRDDVERAFAEVVAGRPEGLIVESGQVLSLVAPQLAELAMRHRLPAVHTRREFADAGGLMSYGPNYADLYRRAAVMVDKILKGAKPAEMPVERPVKFELIVNMKTAKAIGLAIPQSFLLRADEAIE
jgi:putative ABC transport system substrate-binding protein